MAEDYDCGEPFIHTAALDGTLPFSDPISRTMHTRGYSFHTRYASWVGLNIKELKMFDNVVGTIIILTLREHYLGSLFGSKHGRPNFLIFAAVGDESHHLATLCPN